MLADMTMLPMYRKLAKFRQYRQYVLIKSCAVALHGAFRNPGCYFISDPHWLTQMLCPIPSAQSLHTYRPLCISPDKTLYDVVFTHRFWHGKHMIVCEQTRLHAVVLTRCFNKVSLGETVLCTACIKKVPSSQRARPRFAQNSMLYGSSSQWSDCFNASCIFLLMASERRHKCLHKE